MSTPFSYGQLMPSVTKNFGDGPVYEMTAHEYKTLWYAAAADIEKMQQRMWADQALLRQALDTLAYWLEHGETPGSHDMVQRTHDALQERLK